MLGARSAPAQRVKCVDWLRGLAVLVMIECHALFLLDPAYDQSAARQVLNLINGLAAPTFILCAGFAMGLSFGRIGDDVAGLKKRTIKSLRRISVVLVVSLVLKQAFWNLLFHPSRLMWLSVLDCIGLAMLMLMAVLIVTTRHRTMRLLMLSGLLAMFFIIAPWVASPANFGWVTPFLNNSFYSDTWPLVPWAGYAFAGAIIGDALARKPSAATILLTMLTMLGISVAIIFFVPWATSRWINGYDPSLLVNGAERCAQIAIVAILLLGIERLSHFWRWLVANPLMWVIELFGRQSLWAYVIHLLVLFGVGPLYPLRSVWRSGGWLSYGLQATVLMLSTVGICLAIDMWTRRQRTAIRLDAATSP